VSEVLSPDAIVYGLESASDPQLSPDGNGIIFTRSKAERCKKLPGSQIWFSERDGSNARQLTRVGERNSGGRWSPDGLSIAFVSDRVKKTGLFVMPYGGESIELTRHNGPIGELAWSPDGGTIAYVAQFDPANPDERDLGEEDAPRVRVTARVDYKQDSRGYLADLRPQVWLVDVETGERRQLTSLPLDHNFPAWTPDGRKIAVKISNHNGMQSQLGVIDVATGETTLVGPEEGVVSCWAWSPAGDRILIAGDTTLTWQLDLFVYDVASGELRRLTDDLQCLPDAGFATVSPPSQPVWLDEQTALFHAVRGGASGLYKVDVSTGAVEKITEWHAAAGAPSVDAARRFVAQAHSSLDEYSSIVVFDLAQGESKAVVTPNADLPRQATWHRFDIERAGETIEAWLLTPHDTAPSEQKRYPLVLDIHGGPNSFYGYGFNAIQQALAAAGFAVLYCNPRGSGSYGRAFTQAVTKDWAGEDFLDLMAVLDAAIADERFQIDAERLGVYGYSYGGFMTSWIVGHTDRFKAAVIGAPVVDLISFYGTSDIGHLFGPKQIGGTPWTNREEYVKRSPVTYFDQAKTPSLIIHGEADDRCPISQGEQCFVALLENGCEVEFVRYPGGAHTLLRVGYPAHREDILNRLIGWFGQHLGHPAV
jgi:dipeptidyl aminopeptidase/acylaminoacyl peptidase